MGHFSIFLNWSYLLPNSNQFKKIKKWPIKTKNLGAFQVERVYDTRITKLISTILELKYLMQYNHGFEKIVISLLDCSDFYLGTFQVEGVYNLYKKKPLGRGGGSSGPAIAGGKDLFQLLLPLLGRVGQ